MDLTGLRLIANPIHLSEEKEKGSRKVVASDSKSIDIDYLDKLRQTISIKHPTIYLSEFNLSYIDKNIDAYINNINTLRIVDHVVNKMIDEVIDKNKFDFCLPFD
jgi:hypothetical protein